MKIDECAGYLLHEYWQRYGGDQLPVPVDAIAEDLLGLVLHEVDDLDVSGMLIPDERSIWLNATESRRSTARRRFTVGHEIGHWICHSTGESGAKRLCREVGVARGKGIEREANTFAAELLMPHELVIHEAERLRLNVLALAKLFEVSKQAMQLRLSLLGLLPDYMR